ncbi:hypothetical protein RRG08_043154 [Elysia crispata]|uniref:Temptin Cys/Cys disulfide domain-containing protein n=1 Tax=Elysia crispata TaxID=231223 RepID=A0AAE0ZZ10_9GAST|nr:hypothetical protein RRG08_043154 [Elysia crispata]
MFTVVTCLTLATMAGQSLAYQTFQSQVPNGDNVPHPCLPNYKWPGLGHENRLGGGTRNPFGADFARFGYWVSRFGRIIHRAVSSEVFSLAQRVAR